MYESNHELIMEHLYVSAALVIYRSLGIFVVTIGERWYYLCVKFKGINIQPGDK